MKASVNNKYKAFTSLEQSRKLAEILPIESADMYYLAKPDDTNSNMVTSDICIPRRSENDGQAFGEALLGVLQGTNISTPDSLNKIRYSCWNDYDIVYADNPVDACYEMALTLNELKML